MISGSLAPSIRAVVYHYDSEAGRQSQGAINDGYVHRRCGGRADQRGPVHDHRGLPPQENRPPWEYLREVLTRLLSITNSHLGEVMLDAWGKARAPGPGFGYGSSLTRPMVARSQAAT